MDKPEKPVYYRTCRNPLCLKDFTTKRQKQEHCSHKCRQAMYMAKKERVIAAATLLTLQVIGVSKSGQQQLNLNAECLLELMKSVCDLKGWNKDGERPSCKRAGKGYGKP